MANVLYGEYFLILCPAKSLYVFLNFIFIPITVPFKVGNDMLLLAFVLIQSNNCISDGFWACFANYSALAILYIVLYCGIVCRNDSFVEYLSFIHDNGFTFKP